VVKLTVFKGRKYPCGKKVENKTKIYSIEFDKLQIIPTFARPILGEIILFNKY